MIKIIGIFILLFFAITAFFLVALQLFGKRADASTILVVPYTENSDDLEFSLRSAAKIGDCVIALYQGENERSQQCEICKIFEREYPNIHCATEESFFEIVGKQIKG